MMDRADLHTHSSFSDGIDSPTRIVNQAEKRGLGGVSLNDHDTIDGLYEFMTALVTRDVVRVPSLEISTNYGKRSAHLLGFYVPNQNQILGLRLKWLREEREKRFAKMIDKVEEELGFIPSEEYLKDLLEGVDSPGRPHIGKILIDHGIVNDMDEAFDKYLYNGGPIYIKKVKLQVDEAVKLLRDVGAVPVLAHPLDIKVDSIELSLRELKEMGIMGVEVNYDYSHMKIVEEPRVVVDAAKDLNLIGTGGTDYHGGDWRVPLGSVNVPLRVVDQLKEAAKEIGNDLDSWLL